MKAQERKCNHCGARHIYPLSKSCGNGCDAGYAVVDEDRQVKPVNQSGCYHSFRHTPVDFPVYECRKCGKLSK